MSAPHLWRNKMAAILQIYQGPVVGTERDHKTVWSVVNTSLEDELELMHRAFIPLFTEYQKLTAQQQRKFDTIVNRFFNNGTFLMLDQLDSLNEMLDSVGYRTVELENNGEYYQPTEQGKFRPSAAAWKANGNARFAQLEIETQKLYDNVLDIKKFKK